MCGKMVFMKSLVIVNMLGKSYILGTNGNDFKIQQAYGQKKQDFSPFTGFITHVCGIGYLSSDGSLTT